MRMNPNHCLDTVSWTQWKLRLACDVTDSQKEIWSYINTTNTAPAVTQQVPCAAKAERGLLKQDGLSSEAEKGITSPSFLKTK